MVSESSRKTTWFSVLKAMHIIARFHLLFQALLIGIATHSLYKESLDARLTVLIAGLYLIIVGVGFAGLSQHVEKAIKELFDPQPGEVVVRVGFWGNRVMLVAFYFAINITLLIVSVLFLKR